MLNCILLAASALDGLPPTPSQRVPAGFYDALAIVGSAFFVGLLLVLWAAYIRKPRKRGSESRREPVIMPVITKTVEEVDGKRRTKLRERRRDHRPRNPTLAETGGLPPVKSNDPAQPPG